MNGLSMLFWALVYEAHNLVRRSDQRWEMDCAFCDETKRARSKNMVLTKASLHVHFAEGHPDGPEETDLDWGDGGPDPRLVGGSGGDRNVE